jgi:membrane-bound lytic murein transglycosylase D
MNKLLLILALLCLNACVQQPKPAPPDSANTVLAPRAQQVKDSVNQEASPTLQVAPVEPSAAEISDVWIRIRQQIQIDVPNTIDVSQQRDFYRRHQRLLKQVAVRAEPFLFHIVTELEKRKMPVEIALLPIVESSFNPLAQAGAPAGLWQMVPQTARNFGLQRNDWYDGRKDPIASTKAALDYLQYLHDNLGNDWLNAIAAFNSGEGRVQKAIDRNLKQGKAIDFWSLNLPKQSTIYLPKWLALIDLLEHAEKYNVHWPIIHNQPYIGIVNINGPVDLQQVANLTQIKLSELKTLNPGFKRSTTAAGEQSLVLPLSKIDLFAQNKSQLRMVKLAQTHLYKVKSGDSLGLIASKHGTTVAKLKQLNQLKSDQLKIGQQLVVNADTLKKSELVSKTNTKKTQRKSTNYSVKSGDNLWLIAKKFKIDSAELAAYNKLTATSALKPGQSLKIPAHREPSKTSAGVQSQIYVVKKGDSLDKIAKKQKVKLTDLLRLNRLKPDSMLQPGQKLQLK